MEGNGLETAVGSGDDRDSRNWKGEADGEEEEAREGNVVESRMEGLDIRKEP